MTHDAYTRQIYAGELQKDLLRADVSEGHRRNMFLIGARADLCKLLSGCQAGTDAETACNMLIALVADAITDSFDVDWQAEHGAEDVVNALLDTVAPIEETDT